jgi:hypothetical protein
MLKGQSPDTGLGAAGPGNVSLADARDKAAALHGGRLATAAEGAAYLGALAGPARDGG